MTQPVGPSERAQAVRSAMANGGPQQQRGNRLLVLDSPVELVTNGEGEVIGVDVWVRLFEDGTEVPVDPHRIFINPPTGVVDAPAEFDENGEVVSPRVTRLAPGEAFWDVLWENVTSTPNPQGWRTSGTVTTIFGDTADSWIRSDNADYSTARAGSNLFVSSVSDVNLIVGQNLVGTPSYNIFEALISFDTSSISDADLVTDVDLDLWLTTDQSTTDFTVEAREHDWGVTVDSGDWVAGANLGNLTLMASLSSSGIGSTGAYKTFSSEAAFLNATNIKTGTVHLLLCSDRHRTGTQPTGAERLLFSSADVSGTTQDPKLTITHTSPPTANAGADQTAKEGVTVNLDGTGSSDPEDAPSGDPTGTLLTYDWTVTNDGGTGLTTGDLTGPTTATPSFTAPAVAADANITLQLEVTDSDSLTDTDTVVVTVQAAEAEITGAGGPALGGQAIAFFGSGASASVAGDIVVEWDFDNDGDFSEAAEDVTAYLVACETFTGRDWPSQLTGKAGPGKAKFTFRNDDDRFSFFNASSPLNQGSFSLRTGRKIRVRTSTASDPDPTLLARDRFNRTSGALGTAETGQSWSEPLTDDFTISGSEAVAATEGSEHIAVLDVGFADYYTQVKLAEVGAETTGRTGNVVGLVYRYQDSSNYSLAVLDVDAAQLQLIDTVSGTPSTVASEAVEPYDHMTVGVLLSASTVTLYLEGVAVTSVTAVQTDETEVGIYAKWGSQNSTPALDDFYVWDGLPAEVEGILWTGEVSDLATSVVPSLDKVATVNAVGRFAVLANQKVNPPSTVEGRKTGYLIGSTLAMARSLHPPGPLSAGDVTTGPFGMESVSAMEAARRFEETEFGFLYETQEGHVGFYSRSARNAASSQATFSDTDGDGLSYRVIVPFDWRREIVNRVFAGVAQGVPSGVTITAPTTSTNMQVPLPATVSAGDLLLVVGTTNAGAASTVAPPAGWTIVYAQGDSSVAAVSFAKVANGTEGGTSVVFAPGSGAAIAAVVYRVEAWFGSIEGGLASGDLSATDGPLPVFPSWGPQPSLFIAGLHSIGLTEYEYPVGYTDGTFATVGAVNPRSIQTATKLGAASVERPSGFESAASFHVSTVIAVRGFNGDPPVSSGVFEVQVDDTDSQDEHNAIRTHRNPANLFASEADASTYGELVLARFADDRPIVAVEFRATKNAAYRIQAIRRRVSDKITLVADGDAGLGIRGDFFIESVEHKFTDGGLVWDTRWELSPA